MRVLFASAELAPLVRVGGLAEAAGGLVASLRAAALEDPEGERDFACLSAKRKNGKPVRTTVRTIYSSELVRRADAGYTISVEGDGFLYKMVRMMVGAAVETARGRRDNDWIRAMLENPDETERCSACAPAGGLYLVGVDYSAR